MRLGKRPNDRLHQAVLESRIDTCQCCKLLRVSKAARGRIVSRIWVHRRIEALAGAQCRQARMHPIEPCLHAAAGLPPKWPVSAIRAVYKHSKQLDDGCLWPLRAGTTGHETISIDKDRPASAACLGQHALSPWQEIWQEVTASTEAAKGSKARLRARQPTLGGHLQRHSCQLICNAAICRRRRGSCAPSMACRT